MPKLIHTAPLALAAVALAGCAGSLGDPATRNFTPVNNQIVLAQTANPGQFEVVSRGGAGGPEFWCAAGDYVIRGLGVNPSTRVSLTRPVGPSLGVPGARGVGYTVGALPASERPGASVFVSVKDVGASMPAIVAQSLCEPILPFRFDD